jgi:hypothetical protein
MPLRPELRSSAAHTARALLALAFFAAVSVVSPLALPASAGELDDLRKENAQLRRELDAAQEQIRELRAKLGGTAPTASTRGATAAEEAAEGGVAEEKAARTEAELVPMRRVRLRVEGSEADPKSLVTEWMPAREGSRVLEFLRFRLVRSDQGLDPLLSLARSIPSGSLSDVTKATLVIDGTAVSCPRVDFSENRRLRTTARDSTLEREQIATYAIPTEAFGRINTAKEVTLTAGPTSIDLTDEHLAAAGALALRRDRDHGAP